MIPTVLMIIIAFALIMAGILELVYPHDYSILHGAWQVTKRLAATTTQGVRGLRSSLPENEQKMLGQPSQTSIVSETPAERDRAFEPSVAYDMKITVEKPYLRIVTTERIRKIIENAECLTWRYHTGSFVVGGLYDFDTVLEWVKSLSKVKVLVEYADKSEPVGETKSSITCRFCNTTGRGIPRPVVGLLRMSCW